MLLLKKDSLAREEKFREYITKNFYEQGLKPPEFEEKLEVRKRQAPTITNIYDVHKIKCWEYQPAEVKSGVQKNIEGWDRCTISTKVGDTIAVYGVAHIIIDDREDIKIKELTSDDDMFLVEFDPTSDIDISYIKQTTTKGEVGIWSDIEVGMSMRTTSQEYKEILEKKGYGKDRVKILMDERKELFQYGLPLKLRKRVTAIRKSDPSKLK